MATVYNKVKQIERNRQATKELEDSILDIDIRLDALELDVDNLKTQMTDVLNRLGTAETDIQDLIARVDQIDIDQLVQDDQINTLFQLITAIINTLVNIQGTTTTAQSLIVGAPIIADDIETDNPQNSQFDGTNFTIKGTTNITLNFSISGSINDSFAFEVWNTTKGAQVKAGILKTIAKTPETFQGSTKIFINAGVVDIDDVLQVRPINVSGTLTLNIGSTIGFSAQVSSNVDLSGYYTKTETDTLLDAINTRIDDLETEMNAIGNSELIYDTPIPADDAGSPQTTNLISGKLFSNYRSLIFLTKDNAGVPSKIGNLFTPTPVFQIHTSDRLTIISETNVDGIVKTVSTGVKYIDNSTFEFAGNENYTSLDFIQIWGIK